MYRYAQPSSHVLQERILVSTHCWVRFHHTCVLCDTANVELTAHFWRWSPEAESGCLWRKDMIKPRVPSRLKWPNEVVGRPWAWLFEISESMIYRLLHSRLKNGSSFGKNKFSLQVPATRKRFSNVNGSFQLAASHLTKKVGNSYPAAGRGFTAHENVLNINVK